MVKRRGGAVFYSVLVLGLATAGSEACGQAAAPVGAGGTCGLTPDCAEGYACITQPDGSRQCSNDFSSIQSTEDAGLDATHRAPRARPRPRTRRMAPSGRRRNAAATDSRRSSAAGHRLTAPRRYRHAPSRHRRAARGHRHRRRKTPARRRTGECAAPSEPHSRQRNFHGLCLRSRTSSCMSS